MSSTTDQATTRIAMYHTLLATFFSLLTFWGLSYVATWNEYFFRNSAAYNFIFSSDSSRDAIDFYQYNSFAFLIALWISSIIFCVYNTYRVCKKIDSNY
jgi:hypothetical protein